MDVNKANIVLTYVTANNQSLNGWDVETIYWCCTQIRYLFLV